MTQAYVNIQGDLMDANLQPSQHDLQGAFVKSGDGQRIVVDMDLARPIARAMIRRARADAFARNDAATIRAMQSGDQAALEAARAKGDALRAAPQDKRLESVTTPDDLLDVVHTIIREFDR